MSTDKEKKKVEQLKKSLEWHEKQLQTPLWFYIALGSIMFSLIVGGIAYLLDNTYYEGANTSENALIHFGIYLIGGIIFTFIMRMYSDFMSKQIKKRLNNDHN
jgi:uncharacterized membrane protein YvlD (DUF360 family)